MRDVYEELVKAAFVETYDISEDFIDLRGITHSNYVEVLDKVLQGKDLNAKTLILNLYLTLGHTVLSSGKYLKTISSPKIDMSSTELS